MVGLLHYQIAIGTLPLCDEQLTDFRFEKFKEVKSGSACRGCVGTKACATPQKNRSRQHGTTLWLDCWMVWEFLG
eukprot:6481291-Amphidinium_carterae.1